MADENTPPENQDTAKDGELYFGKYKSKEEAESAFKQMEKEQSDLRERLDRTERLNRLMDFANEERQITPPTMEESEYVKVPNALTGVMDEEQAKAFEGYLNAKLWSALKEVETFVSARVTESEGRRIAEEKFYRLYPKLEPFKDEVNLMSKQLSEELGPARFKVPFEKLAEEVADRVQKKLQDTKQKLTKTTLHLERGQASEPKIEVPESPPKVTTEAERAQKYFDTEAKAFAERQQKPLRG